MALRGAGALDSYAIDAWTEETQERIRDETEDVGGGPSVTVVFDGQSESFEGRASTRRDADAAAGTSAGGEAASRSRRLGKERSPLLRIDFTTVVEAAWDDRDPREIVAAGFRTASQQKEYIYALKAADSASFEGVRGMTMEVEGTVITEAITKADPPDSLQSAQQVEMVQPDRTVPIAIGGAAAGLLLLLVAGGVGAAYQRRRASSSPSAPEKDLLPPAPLPGKLGLPGGIPARSRATEATTRTATTTTTTPTESSPQHGTFDIVEPNGAEDDVSALADPHLAYEIVAPGGAQDDISTLPEPPLGDFFLGEDAAGRSRLGDATTAGMLSSVGQLHEYGVTRGGRRTDATTTTGDGAHSCVEDGTLEELYRGQTGGGPGGPRGEGRRPDDAQGWGRTAVVCPAGELGIVLDDAAGGVPAVHAIRETSALRGRVAVGDLLVAVDEVDCRGLSAKQVTRFIGGRRKEPARTLVLLRGV